MTPTSLMASWWNCTLDDGSYWLFVTLATLLRAIWIDIALMFSILYHRHWYLLVCALSPAPLVSTSSLSHSPPSSISLSTRSNFVNVLLHSPTARSLPPDPYLYQLG